MGGAALSSGPHPHETFIQAGTWRQALSSLASPQRCGSCPASDSALTGRASGFMAFPWPPLLQPSLFSPDHHASTRPPMLRIFCCCVCCCVCVCVCVFVCC